MLRFLKITARRYGRNKSQIFIAAGGLVLGWISFIAIGLYLYRELTYDRFHANHERIYRVTHNEKAGEIPGTRHVATVGPPLGPALKQEFPQVEEAVRFRYHDNVIMRYQDKEYYEDKVFFADPSVFKVFSFDLIRGDIGSSLSLPNNVVITQRVADKYFGKENPIGKEIRMNPDVELTVTGVLKDIPSNSHLQIDFLLPFEAFKVPFGYPVTLESWGWISFHTYVLIKHGQSAASLEQQLPELVKKHWPDERAKRFKLQLQPLKDIYLGEVTHEQIPSGNKTSVYVLAAAGLLILVIATFNFVNLFSVMSLARAKDVGVRKVLGAGKFVIVRGLVVESVAIMVGSFVLAAMLLPLFPASIVPFNSVNALPVADFAAGAAILLTLALALGFIAGIFPARFIVAVNFQRLLKGSFKFGRSGVVIRKTMLLGQFVASSALIACVVITSSQIDYVQNKDLGFAKDQLLLLRVPGEQITSVFPILKARLEQNNLIASVSIGGGRMDGDTGNVPIYVPDVTDEFGKPMAIDAVSFDFFETLGIRPLAGREFTLPHASDTLRGVLINEAAAKEFGWTPESALGKKIRVGDLVLDGEVIGVLPNFNYSSLRVGIKPLVISYPRTRLQDVYVRYNSNHTQAIIAAVQKDWEAVAPDLPFDYDFLTQHLDSLYVSDRAFSTMFRFFAALATLIACMGLFGLISQDVLYRMKEIGIRKVLGASVSEITVLVLKQFVVLVLVGNVVAWPVAYISMNEWLSEFAYHVNIHWSVFPLSAIVTLMLALVAGSSNSVRAAMVNPVDSIRKD